MSLQDTQARIKGRVWKAIAQTELDLSVLDKETVESLVDLITEAALLEIDDSLGESLKEEQAQPATSNADTVIDEDVFDNQKEDILWEGRPFLSLSVHYTITDERIRFTEGILGKSRENIELVRIQDIDYSQTFSERLLKIGDINISSRDSSHPGVVLRNIKNPDEVYEILRRAVLNARRKHNFTYREVM